MTAPNSTTVYIVDDADEVRMHLIRALADTAYEIRAFPNATSFLGVIQPEDTGCIILDVDLPDVNGLELQRTLKTMACEQPVIFLTGHADVAMAVQAVKNGAFEFIEKPFPTATLLRSVNGAIKHDGQLRASRIKYANVKARLASLTPRERQVFDRIVAGQPTKQIAAEFNVTNQAIDAHRSRLMRKLGVDNLADLVKLSLIDIAGGYPY